MARAYVELAEILYVSNLDTLKYLSDISLVIAEKNLSLNSSEKAKKSFQEIQAISMGNIGYVHHIKGDYLTALNYYQKSLKIADKLGVKKEIALMLHNIGAIYINQGDQANALAYYERSLAIEREIGGKKAMTSLFNNIGLIYKVQGNIAKGLEYFNKSLKLSEEINYVDAVAVAMTNIGALNFEQGEVKRALDYYYKSLKIHQKIGSKRGMSYSLSYIGAVYKSEGDLEKSLDHFQESLQLRKEIGYKSGIGASLTNIASIYEQQGDTKKALEHYLQSLKIRKEIGDKMGVSTSLINIARINFNKGDLAEAKGLATQSFNISKSLGFPENIMISADLLSKIHQKEKSWENAFNMQNLYTTMRDSIRNETTEKEVIRQQANYEIRKKEQEIGLLSSENEVQELKLHKNRILATLFSVGFGLTLILVVVVYKGNKKNKVINKMISKKSEERKVMLQEIHHRVKNNLQVVNSLLRMQSRKSSDKDIINTFKETQSRVMSMAKLHEKMYLSGDLKRLNAKEHISMLVEEIVKNYAVGTKIDLNLDINEVYIDAQTMMPLSLIINEMITNSLKYAFKGKEEGEITVKLSPT